MQIENCKMENKASQISDRLLDYGVTLIKICIKLNRTVIDRPVGNRLFYVQGHLLELIMKKLVGLKVKQILYINCKLY